MRVSLTFLLAAAIIAPPAGAVPSLEGIWSADREASDIWPQDPRFTPRGHEALDNHDPTADDPALYCAVYMPRAMVAWGRKPIEIFQADDRLWTLHERMHQVRRIYLDGRPPPEDEGPTWMGHSTGIWEGETLVVETTLIREQPNPGPPLQVLQSDELRVVERYRTLDDGQTLEAMITIDDPRYYTEPWTIRKVWSRSDDEVFYEYVCSDPRYHPTPAN